MNTYLYMNIYTYIYTYICIYSYIIYVSLYIYTCIYIHIYTCIEYSSHTTDTHNYNFDTCHLLLLNCGCAHPFSSFQLVINQYWSLGTLSMCVCSCVCTRRCVWAENVFLRAEKCFCVRVVCKVQCMRGCMCVCMCAGVCLCVGVYLCVGLEGGWQG